MTIFDGFAFITGIILIAIGGFLLYSFLIKPYKQNSITFKGVFFLGPIPIIFNNDKPKEPIITDNTDNNSNNFHNPQGQIFVTVGTGGAELYPLTGQALYVASQYLGFGFLNIDMINNNNNGVTRMIGKFYANNDNSNGGTTIKDHFTITKAIK